MPVYDVIIVRHATSYVSNVVADSPEDAAHNRVWEHDDSSPALCHYCARHLELGDAVQIVVLEGGEEVFDEEI